MTHQKKKPQPVVLSRNALRIVNRGEQVYAALFATTGIEHLSTAAIVFYEDGSDQVIYLSDCGNPKCYAKQIFHGCFDPVAINGLVVIAPGEPNDSRVALAVHVVEAAGHRTDIVLPSVSALMTGQAPNTHTGGLDHLAMTPGLFGDVDMMEVLHNLVCDEDDADGDQSAERAASESCGAPGNRLH